MEINDTLYRKLSELHGVDKEEVVHIFNSLFDEVKKELLDCDRNEIRLRGIGAFKRKWINLHFRQVFNKQHVSWRRFNKKIYNTQLQKWKNLKKLYT